MPKLAKKTHLTSYHHHPETNPQKSPTLQKL